MKLAHLKPEFDCEINDTIGRYCRRIDILFTAAPSSAVVDRLRKEFCVNGFLLEGYDLFAKLDHLQYTLRYPLGYHRLDIWLVLLDELTAMGFVASRGGLTSQDAAELAQKQEIDQIRKKLEARLEEEN